MFVHIQESWLRIGVMSMLIIPVTFLLSTNNHILSLFNHVSNIQSELDTQAQVVNTLVDALVNSLDMNSYFDEVDLSKIDSSHELIYNAQKEVNKKLFPDQNINSDSVIAITNGLLVNCMQKQNCFNPNILIRFNN